METKIIITEQHIKHLWFVYIETLYINQAIVDHQFTSQLQQLINAIAIQLCIVAVESYMDNDLFYSILC
jgi:hypothetical protein